MRITINDILKLADLGFLIFLLWYIFKRATRKTKESKGEEETKEAEASYNWGKLAIEILIVGWVMLAFYLAFT